MESQIRALAASRVVLGAAMLLAPGPILRVWLGREAGGPLPSLLARSVAGRDLALGLGTLLALQHDSSPRGWLEATILADASDALALLAGARHLSWPRVLGAAVPTAAALVLGRRLVSQSEH
ncbi:MAG TPA: hypothetical protein VG455_03305 [Acidimicrobiales bacterium]|nr:hypothetical protein [Acidimicrobiales bacterium]